MFNLGVLLPPNFTKLDKAVHLAVEMINGREISQLDLGRAKLSALYFQTDLYSPYQNFQEGNYEHHIQRYSANTI